MQHASFQHEYADIELQVIDEVADHHVFSAQTVGLRDGGITQRREVARVGVLRRGLQQQGFGLRQFGLEIPGSPGVEFNGSHAAARWNSGRSVTASPW